mmetsp:Transcript_87145/g.232313  ORF Transcript_87145/g.232313 Transcript_87145/m.232313 type:complete len:256 (-) Transcript_87145:97-864(-)
MPQEILLPTPENDRERELHSEVLAMRRKVMDLQSRVDHAQVSSQAQILQSSVEETKHQIKEYQTNIDKLEGKLKDLEADAGKSTPQNEDSIINTLEVELVRTSNHCLTLEAKCKELEIAFQRNQTEIKRLSARKGTAAPAQKSDIFVQSSVPSASSYLGVGGSGVGITLEKLPIQHTLSGHFVVQSVAPGSSASEQQIVPGDIVIKIDNSDSVNMDLSTAKAKLQGLEGSKVKLELYRPMGGQYILLEPVLTRKK